MHFYSKTKGKKRKEKKNIYLVFMGMFNFMGFNP
jgi:hypothetical protein